VSYEAEQAMLAGILANNVAYFRCSQIARAEHFADALHGRLFDTIGKIIIGGGRADVLTVMPHFEKDPAFRSIGEGRQYLTRLAASIVTMLNLPDYAETIRDLWLRRQLLEYADKLVAQASNFDREADETIANSTRDLYDLSKDGRHTARTRREVAMEL
ncbi:MAG: DnaB-like helicase N-terminal domain-containing protein, partial [Candidatus Dormibacteria bacterium]